MRDFCLYETNVIHKVNCLEMIDELPKLFIDATITDFPYGIDYQSNHRAVKFEKIANDEKPYIDWIKPLYAKTAEAGRLICFYRYDVQDELIDEIRSAGFIIKSQLVWDKGNWSAGDLNAAFGIQHELMIYATKGRYEFKNGRPSTVYNAARVPSDRMIHPNEKPIELNRALIRDTTSRGELVADFFSGSGSCAAAAKIEGRDFIACDLSETHVNNGNNRVKNVTTSFI